MQKIRIIVDSFEEFQDRIALWSRIYLTAGEFCFPSNCWTDATSAMLVMWADNISNILTGATSAAELFFMDGEYTVVLETTSLLEGHMRFLGPNGEIGVLYEVDLMYFARQVLSACAKVTNHYQEFYNAYQLQELTDAAEYLRKIIFKRIHPI